MKTAITPQDIRPPFARYSHAVTLEGARRLLTVSGQLGLAADDTCPPDVGAQADICFGNIDAILREAGMTREDVLRISAFVTDRADMPAYMAARDRWCATVDVPPASTLVIVSGFTRPEFKVEVEVIAAR